MSDNKSWNEMSHAERIRDLSERVRKFRAMELPGQPRMMHIGTAYLVANLWDEVQKLYEEHIKDTEEHDGTY